MRDPQRIRSFTSKLVYYWETQVPDWRFGQFMSNFFGFVEAETQRDIFFIEEEQMEELLHKFFRLTEVCDNECNMEIPPKS